MGDSSRRRRFDKVVFCRDQMYAICEEGRLWYTSYNPGGCPWKEDSHLPEIEDPVGPADDFAGADKIVATDDELLTSPLAAAKPAPPPAPADAAIASVLAQREEILAAFVAKYGAEPDHVEQVEQHMPDGSINWFPRLKTTAGLQHVLVRLAPTGGPAAAPSNLVERVLRRLPSGTDPVFARQAMLEIAEWADEEGLFRTRRRLCEEVNR
jgi:hypothetical protein